MSRNSDIIRDSRGFLAIKRVLLVALIAVVGVFSLLWLGMS
ncbi:hypothetical protein [Weissella cibaria]|nr:hypothetical protein [Weissella cibaria]